MKMETIALNYRQAITFWKCRCRSERARTCAASRKNSRLCRIRLSASIWILLPWTSGELDRRNRSDLIDTSGWLRLVETVRRRESQIRVPETPSAIHPRAQRSVDPRRDVRLQVRWFVPEKQGLIRSPSFTEIVSDDFQITSRPEGAMLGLDFAPANSALGGSESGA